ncbi:MAG: glutaredoxin family protein [Deltaproteobacteria bacterium]|nr:glutaredoxin family protein [Deltaproteobacteria bacterium]
MSHLTCQFIFNSGQHGTTLPSSGFAVDLAEDPHSAHQLIKLGVSPRSDLPAVLLTDAAGKLRVIGLRLGPEEAEEVIRGRALPTDRVVLYSATWCPDCKKVKRALDESPLSYEEVDLDTNLKAEALVLEKSGGRRVVPTLEFGERLFVFNPDPGLLSRLIDGASSLGA